MDTIIGFITDNAILSIITAVISLAAAIAAVTPTRVDNDILDAVMRVVNILGLNVGKAKNADDGPK